MVTDISVIFLLIPFAIEIENSNKRAAGKKIVNTSLSVFILMYGIPISSKALKYPTDSIGLAPALPHRTIEFI